MLGPFSTSVAAASPAGGGRQEAGVGGGERRGVLAVGAAPPRSRGSVMTPVSAETAAVSGEQR